MTLKQNARLSNQECTDHVEAVWESPRNFPVAAGIWRFQNSQRDSRQNSMDEDVYCQRHYSLVATSWGIGEQISDRNFKAHPIAQSIPMQARLTERIISNLACLAGEERESSGRIPLNLLCF
jgi:hypothetical protein